MLAMPRHAAISTKWIQREFSILLVLAAVALPTRAKAQGIGSAGDCAGIFTDDFEAGALWGTWSCGPGF